MIYSPPLYLADLLPQEAPAPTLMLPVTSAPVHVAMDVAVQDAVDAVSDVTASVPVIAQPMQIMRRNMSPDGTGGTYLDCVPHAISSLNFLVCLCLCVRV